MVGYRKCAFQLNSVFTLTIYFTSDDRKFGHVLSDLVGVLWGNSDI